MTRGFPFLDHPGVIPFAHRGNAAGAVENTVEAFRAVVDLGYRYVETDVRTTRDGKLVVFHDENLQRIAGVDRALRDLRHAELAEFGVPLLTDVLESFPDVRFNVDMKDWPSVEALAGVIAATRSAARLCAASFSEGRLRRIRRLAGPELCTSAGVAGIAGFVLGRPGAADRPEVPRVDTERPRLDGPRGALRRRRHHDRRAGAAEGPAARGRSVALVIAYGKRPAPKRRPLTVMVLL